MTMTVTALIGAFLLLGSVACTSAGTGAGQAVDAGDELVFSVAGMSCENCAEQAVTVIRSQVPGVVEARVTFDTKVGRVRTDGSVTQDQILTALGTLGFEARFPGDPPSDATPLSQQERAGLDIQTVAHGEAIDIRDHLAHGKITVFDYYADWCGPCHLLTPKLERLLLRHEGLALRKVDIDDWDSEAAQQATRDFHLAGLPWTRIFDDQGVLLGQVQGNFIELIEDIVRRNAPTKGA